ncbi:quinol:cytochrome c oxidoreductase quinone-binding subunit 2 [Arcticibacter tournemirensis]|uniref:Quinol:cytochrome C oxidoreductase n=1 Tax=Arcticibacter tournemirensis TaxID=699437 RepID=A0A4Q0M3K5_9SPHI|nr:quinol:cytochrome C oxidoreductase [Arcticibacter tournemirensis]KAA8478915.1 quinol:cytochrome C oxidoreductase [Arcticibacter tournemirensis]RXF67510.1 quinol:cytochrome C oxidoreductase [Arcticibacter tournemirensis]TQM49135.1 quinol:cytochrome c oxidoreductase quinone-binding subunit 2 [Arcticibacter tournemirensis]
MGTHNHHTHNFNQQYEFSGKAKTWSLIAIVIGIAAIVYGFLIDSAENHSERTFANLLLMSYYFTCVCAAGAFFVALQYVAQAGWPTGLLRIPQAFAKVLPVAAIILIVVCLAGLFTHNLYHHWHQEGIAVKGSANYDPIIANKAGYLNVPFFTIRQVIFLGVYSIFAVALARFSNREDIEGGLKNYKKSFKFSVIFLVIFGFTTPIWAFDTIMSLEAHWFSTMFGWYNFAALWVSGLCVITITTILLKRSGYMSWINDSHLHDLGKLIFGFSIFWTYLWFSQFLLTWYANIPEETVYFYKRWEDNYKPWFWLNIVINFVAPVLILMTRDAKRRTNTLLFVCILLLMGHWLDYYIMIMPGTVEEHPAFGITEIGIAIGFAGLFSFLMLSQLSRKPLIPKQHPFLEESLHHSI